jgi:hypothetical protein
MKFWGRQKDKEKTSQAPGDESSPVAPDEKGKGETGEQKPPRPGAASDFFSKTETHKYLAYLISQYEGEIEQEKQEKAEKEAKEKREKEGEEKA